MEGMNLTSLKYTEVTLARKSLVACGLTSTSEAEFKGGMYEFG